LRYQGHGAVWRTLSKLGLLEHDPDDKSGGISPRQFLRQHLEPRLRYGDEERDMVILRIEAESVDEHAPRLVMELIDYRDLDSGLMAMNRTVGYPASIAAQMLAAGEISQIGLLNPVRDVPYDRFREELAQRNLQITVREEPRRSPVPAPMGLKSGKTEAPLPGTIRR
jgi:saccharopine dehydrogenase-like NADP-dependent oxidoreductase